MIKTSVRKTYPYFNLNNYKFYYVDNRRLLKNKIDLCK